MFFYTISSNYKPIFIFVRICSRSFPNSIGLCMLLTCLFKGTKSVIGVKSVKMKCQIFNIFPYVFACSSKLINWFVGQCVCVWVTISLHFTNQSYKLDRANTELCEFIDTRLFFYKNIRNDQGLKCS